jgi:glycerol uptake facilitator-like aquaporin
MVRLCPRGAPDCDPLGLIARTFVEEYVCTFAFVNFVLMIKYHIKSEEPLVQALLVSMALYSVITISAKDSNGCINPAVGFA